MEILNNILSLFQSPRFISFYWQTGSVALIGLLNLISENTADLGLPAWAVVFVGLALSQLTKAITNLTQGKPMGFARKVN